MKNLHILNKKNIAANQTMQLQPKDSNRLEAVQALSSYAWLIILLGLFLISGLLLFVQNEINYDYDRTIEETSRETMNLSIAFEEHVRTIIADADKDMLNLKETYEQDGISSPVIADYVQNATKDPTRSLVAIHNEQGVVVASSNQDIIGLKHSDRDFFLVHQATVSQDLEIGKTILSRVNSQHIIPLSRRINKPDGSFGGIVYIGLRSDYFLSFYQKIDLGQQQLISLSGRDGFNRARRGGDNLETGQDIRCSAYWKKVQEKILFGSYLEANILDGVTRITSYRAMPEYPLIVAVGKSSEVALTGHEQRKQYYILGAIVVSFLILTFCSLLINWAAKQRKINMKLERLVGERTQELQAQYEVLQKREEKLFELNRELVEKSMAVQTEKDRLSSLIDSMSEEVWFTDTEKRVTLVNPSGLRELRIGSSTIGIAELVSRLEIRRPDGSLCPIEETPPVRALQGEIVRNQQETIRIPVSGKLRYREVNSNPVMDTSKNIIGSVSVVHDITDRKAMEDELKKHRENLQILVEEQVRKIHEINTDMAAIFDSISDPFYVLDKEWRLTYINKEAAQSNCKMSEADIGENIWKLNPELVGGELYRIYHEACATNIPIHTIYKNIIHGDLNDIHIYPYPNGLFVYFRDVTEQKKYEAEMSKMDRLNIIGEMAASIGHEVRNPMTTVRGYLQWFARKAAFIEYRAQFVVMIEELDRANTIITEFLSLAKDKNVNLQSTDLNTIIRGLYPLLQADAFRRGSTIELELGDTPKVLADDNEIRQCILNVVANGLDAMPEGGKMTIGTAKSGNQVIMTVRDGGPGIPPEIIDKLWLPFFTTKEHGTGLGLPVCYQIAQRHQATIEVETGPEGTAFHFIFSQEKKAD